MERLMEIGDKDIAENYQIGDNRPRLTRLRSQEVNTEFPQDYNKRSRFTVLGKDSVLERFKVMETHTQEKRQTTGRMRTSGDRGAYNSKSHGFNSNRNNHNPIFSDLIIP